jgi:competence protein ComEC
MMRCPWLPPMLLAALAACGGTAASAPLDDAPLELYFIDVEGGQATLVVGPTGESMLIDTGWPVAGRDAERILAAAHAAGLDRIDHLVITHFHDDHVGGLEELAARIAFGRVITHGSNTESGRMAGIVDPIYARAMAAAGVAEVLVRPGDAISIAGLGVRVLTARRDLIPLEPGGGPANPACEGAVRRRNDTSDNSASVGLLFTYGRFRFLDIGDVTQDLEHDLACPVNRIGEVDLYLTTHHGSGQSNAPVLVHALNPRVAIMNNGARKGGDPTVIETVRSTPRLEDLWMLHYSEAAGEAGNVAEPLIANLSDAPTANGHDEGFGIRVAAWTDGTFTVTNERNGYTRSYSP